ncbi:MAG: hypothetical protein K0U42_07000, partial [Actinomycetia bacterium]|nr:hypothetical protein [Actinomycetes bacterium]
DQIPPTHKSLAFALRFRGDSQTLTATQLQEYRSNVIAAVSEQLGGTLR